MKKTKVYKAIWVSESTHIKLVREAFRGNKKRSMDKVITDLLKKQNEK